MFDFNLLDELHEKVKTADDFHEPWNFFFDLVDTDAFLEVGKKVKYPDLLKGIEVVGQQMLIKPKAKLIRPLVIEVKKRNFFHGGFTLDNYMGTFFFFKGSDLGMVALTVMPFGGNSLMSRFSLTEIKTSLANPPSCSLN